MADLDAIVVAQILPGDISFLGKNEGLRLGGAVARQLAETSKDIFVDFTGIQSLSPSAATMFIYVITSESGDKGLSRLTILQANPSIIESLEHAIDTNNGTDSSHQQLM